MSGGELARGLVILSCVLLVCWIAAFVACLGYGVASVLQADGARAAPVETRLRLSGVAMIWLQLPYLAGLALDGVGFVGNVVALQRLPLYLVQSVVNASVVVTALVARWRGSRLSRWEWSAVGVVAVGLALVSVSAGPQATAGLSTRLAYLILAAAILPLLLGVVSLRLSGRARPIGLAVAAGWGYCGVAVGARVLVIPSVWWHVFASPLLWTIVAYGVIGVAMFALALQRGAVTAVTAIVVVMELIVPGGVGLLWLGDRIGPGLAVPAALGFALTLTGTVVLARHMGEPAPLGDPAA